jgi:hypothetical protein
MTVERHVPLLTPIHISMASGLLNARAILGAVSASYINILVTGNQTAKEFIESNKRNVNSMMENTSQCQTTS